MMNFEQLREMDEAATREGHELVFVAVPIPREALRNGNPEHLKQRVRKVSARALDQTIDMKIAEVRGG